MQKEDDKVKVVYHNDPKRFKFVTKQAAAYLSPKWVLAEGESSGSQKKAAAVAPVASTVDRKAELRERYNELTGKEAEAEWNEARLFVEITKAEKIAPLEARLEEPQVKVEEPQAAPNKRGPKKKVDA